MNERQELEKATTKELVSYSKILEMQSRMLCADAADRETISRHKEIVKSILSERGYKVIYSK